MQEDLFSSLVKTLGFLSARGIILQQIKNLDALSIMRLMRESRLLRGIIGEGEDVWGSHYRKLDDDLQKSTRGLIMRYVNCCDDRKPHLFLTTAFVALFPTAYQQFLLSWTRLPHVWIDRASKQMLQVQDWSLSVDSADLEEDKLWFRHLLGHDEEISGYFALADDTRLKQSLITVRMPDKSKEPEELEWLEPSQKNPRYTATCKKLENLLRNPLRRKLSLTAVPGQWVRLSKNGKDVAISDTRYASKSLLGAFPKGKLFSLAVTVKTRPTRSRILLSFLDGKFVQDNAPLSSKPYDLSFMFSPSFLSIPDDWNINPTFETSLFFEDVHQVVNIIICLRVDVVQSNPDHPNNFGGNGRMGMRGKLFRFQVMNVVKHYTDSDPTIDAPITVGLCDACQTQPIAVQCGNNCGAAFYCGQECADSHVNQHKCH